MGLVFVCIYYQQVKQTDNKSSCVVNIVHAAHLTFSKTSQKCLDSWFYKRLH